MTGCHCHQITIFAEIYGKNPAVFVIKNLNKYGIFGRPGSKIIFNTVVQGRTGCWNIAVSEIILGIIFALTVQIDQDLLSYPLTGSCWIFMPVLLLIWKRCIWYTTKTVCVSFTINRTRIDQCIFHTFLINIQTIVFRSSRLCCRPDTSCFGFNRSCFWFVNISGQCRDE